MFLFNNILNKFFFSIIFILISSGSLAAQFNELDNWNFFNMKQYQKEKFRLDGMIHARFVDQYSRFSLLQIAERVSYNVIDELALGINYSFFTIHTDSSNAGEGDVDFQHRFEGEVNPRFKLANFIEYVSRNRFEYLVDESFDKIGQRYRHRSGLEFADVLPKQIGIFINTELFYDFKAHQLNQYRIVPGGFRIPFLGIRLSIYPMLQLLKGESNWKRINIFGIDLNVDFTN
jgi:hypothetical protein